MAEPTNTDQNTSKDVGLPQAHPPSVPLPGGTASDDKPGGTTEEESFREEVEEVLEKTSPEPKEEGVLSERGEPPTSAATLPSPQVEVPKNEVEAEKAAKPSLPNHPPAVKSKEEVPSKADTKNEDLKTKEQPTQEKDVVEQPPVEKVETPPPPIKSDGAPEAPMPPGAAPVPTLVEEPKEASKDKVVDPLAPVLDKGPSARGFGSMKKVLKMLLFVLIAAGVIFGGYVVFQKYILPHLNSLPGVEEPIEEPIEEPPPPEEPKIVDTTTLDSMSDIFSDLGKKMEELEKEVSFEEDLNAFGTEF